MDLSDVINDPDLAEPFLVLRQSGSWQAGGWVANPPQILNFFGVCTNVEAEDIQMIPEADRVREARSFYSTTQMFVSNEATPGTSDVIIWQGGRFRVYSVANYSNRNYWKAVAARIAGN